MSSSTIACMLIIIVAVVLIGFYRLRYRQHHPDIFVPKAACLIFFSIYENYVIFIALQTWALLGASLAMRMPAPRSQEASPPTRRTDGIFGLFRASGYISEDPENDLYLRAAHLPY